MTGPRAYEGAPDPDAYVPRPATERCLAELERWARGDGPPAALLWGPPGSGKSLLLRLLEARLAGIRRCATLVNPTFGRRELCLSVLESLKVPREDPPEDAFERAVASLGREGSGVALLIDDAELLPTTTEAWLREVARRSGGHLIAVLAVVDPGHRDRLQAAFGADALLVTLDAPYQRPQTEGARAERPLTLGSSIVSVGEPVWADLELEPPASLGGSPRPEPEPPGERRAVGVAWSAGRQVEWLRERAAAWGRWAARRIARVDVSAPLRWLQRATDAVGTERLKLAGAFALGAAMAAAFRLGAATGVEERPPRADPVRSEPAVVALPSAEPAPVEAIAVEPAVREAPLVAAVGAGARASAPTGPPAASGTREPEASPGPATAVTAVAQPEPEPGPERAPEAAPPAVAVATPQPVPAPVPMGRSDPVPVARAAPPAPAIEAPPPPSSRRRRGAESGTRAAPVGPAPVLVSVNARPWATIWIDGEEVGETPLAEIPIVPGRHTVAAVMSDGRRIEREVEIGPRDRHLRFE